jgi:hypothetical protein
LVPFFSFYFLPDDSSAILRSGRGVESSAALQGERLKS